MANFFAIETENEALEAVKSNGYALRYVKDQTPEVCLEAVKNDGDALRYVLIRAIFDDLAKLFNL